jgi:hypothetical protein
MEEVEEVEEAVGRMTAPHPTTIANEDLKNLRFPPTGNLLVVLEITTLNHHHPSRRDQNRSPNRFEAIRHEIPFPGMILKETLVVVAAAVAVVAVEETRAVVAVALAGAEVAAPVLVATVVVVAAVVVAVAVNTPGIGAGTTNDDRVTVALKTPESVGTGGGTMIHDRTAGKKMRAVDEEADSVEEVEEEDSLEEGEEEDSLEEGTGTLHAAMIRG